MKRRAVLLLSVALLAVSAGAEGLRELSFMTATPTDRPPAIDGALDDACWAKAAVHDAYFEYWNQTPRRSQLRTECRVLYDARGLYLGVRNCDTNVVHIRRNVTRDGNGDTWLDDCAELYIDPKANGVGFYKFVINANGCVTSAWRMDSANVQNAWTAGGIEKAAKVFGDRWEFEIFLPWSAFHGLSKPEPGAVWTFNHVRYSHSYGWMKGFSCSSPGGNYKTPRRFGYLYFTHGTAPDAKTALSVVSARQAGDWAIQIGEKTYLHDDDGIRTIDGAVADLVEKTEAEAKARDERFTQDAVSLVTNAAFVAEKLPLPLAGRYDLNPPANPYGFNGFYRHNIDRTFPTSPHVDWADAGLAAKPPRVLFMTDRVSGVRAAKEFAARFPVEDLYFPGNFGESGVYEDPVSLGSSADKARQFETLLAKDPDVFVFSGFPNAIPPKYLYEIFRRVRDDGKGLVVLGRSKLLNPFKKYVADEDARRMLAEAVPFAELPGMRPPRVRPGDSRTAACLRPFRFGKGRVLQVPMFGYCPWDYGWKAMWEAREAALWAFVDWARGADPDYAFEGAVPSVQSEVLAADQRYLPLRVRAIGRPPKGAALRWRLRTEEGAVLGEGTVPLADGTATCLVPTDNLACGLRGYVDCRVVESGKTAAVAFRVLEKQTPLGRLTVGCEGTFWIPENSRKAWIPVSWTNGLPEDCTVTLELADSPHFNLRYEKSCPLRRGNRGCRFDISSVLPFPTLGARARVTVTNAAGRVLARATKLVYFPNSRIKDYMLISWGDVHTPALPEFFGPELVERFGYEDNIGRDGTPASMAFNAHTVSYFTRVCLGVDKGETVPRIRLRGPLQNEAGKTVTAAGTWTMDNPEWRALVERNMHVHATNIVMNGVSVWSLGDECGFSYDIGVGAGTQKSFERFLAKKYGTVEKYNAVHKTNLVSFAEARNLARAPLLDAGRTAAWLDHMQFAETLYADTLHWLAGCITRAVPGAVVGAEGSAAGNLEETLKTLKFWGPYRDVVNDELLKSLAPSAVRGVWWGGYVNSETRDGYPCKMWECLLTGVVNCDEWFCCRPGASESAFACDYNLMPYVQQMEPHLKSLRRGVGALLTRVPFRDDGFAFYHSHASSLAAQAMDGTFAPAKSIAPMIRSCYRTGLSTEFVTPGTLNRLDPAKLKVLFLPGACALSDAEVAAILAYAKKGGRVLADPPAGLYDAFLQRRTKGPFEGVANCTVRETSFFADALARSPEEFDASFLSCLEPSGIRSCERVMGLEPAATVFRVRELKEQGMRIVGLKTVPSELGKRVVVDFGREGWAYATDGGFLGRLSKVEIAKLDVPFKLYSVFDAEQQAPAFAPTLAKRVASYPADGLRRGSTYRLSVKDPSGCEIPSREEVFTVDAKKPAVRTFRFALSDAEGAWTLVLRDIATGLETAATVDLKDGQN